jgi:hypothetical protein
MVSLRRRAVVEDEDFFRGASANVFICFDALDLNRACNRPERIAHASEPGQPPSIAFLRYFEVDLVQPRLEDKGISHLHSVFFLSNDMRTPFTSLLKIVLLILR